MVRNSFQSISSQEKELERSIGNDIFVHLKVYIEILLDYGVYRVPLWYFLHFNRITVIPNPLSLLPTSVY